MTKREFDKETKENWGSKGMASDERCHYRERRMLEHNGCGAFGAKCAPSDYIQLRALEMAELRRGRLPWEPVLPTLGIGTRFRAPQRYRAERGLPMLAARASWANV